ncbi:Uncharacterized protein PBTT_07740 [Plasmodiophora brassicae]
MGDGGADDGVDERRAVDVCDLLLASYDPAVLGVVVPALPIGALADDHLQKLLWIAASTTSRDLATAACRTLSAALWTDRRPCWSVRGVADALCHVLPVQVGDDNDDAAGYVLHCLLRCVHVGGAGVVERILSGAAPSRTLDVVRDDGFAFSVETRVLACAVVADALRRHDAPPTVRIDASVVRAVGALLRSGALLRRYALPILAGAAVARQRRAPPDDDDDDDGASFDDAMCAALSACTAAGDEDDDSRAWIASIAIVLRAGTRRSPRVQRFLDDVIARWQR